MGFSVQSCVELEVSISSYTYLQGTVKPVSVVRDGSVTNLTYDYRQRVIETKVYPYSGKMLSSKKVYVENKLFSGACWRGRGLLAGPTISRNTNRIYAVTAMNE